jgi:hypothetical protein
VPRFDSRLSFTRSSKVLGNRNATVYDEDDYYTQDDVSKEFSKHQAMTELQQLHKLEQLVQQEDEIMNVHTEQESTTTLVTSTSSAVDTTKQDEEGFPSVVWKARLLLLGAAVLYGTNFSVIKILGDTMPVGISSTLRFGLASLATLPWLLAPPKDGSSLLPISTNAEDKNWWESPWDTLQSVTSTTTVGAALAGFEVGLWNSIGYLAQAVGLETTDASKVHSFLYGTYYLVSSSYCSLPLHFSTLFRAHLFVPWQFV